MRGRVERFAVEHVGVTIRITSEFGVWFALRADAEPEGRPDLFSGPVSRGMAGQLRAIADYLDGLPQLAGGDVADAGE